MSYNTTCAHRQLTFRSLTFVYDPDQQKEQEEQETASSRIGDFRMLIVPFHGEIFCMKECQTGLLTP